VAGLRIPLGPGGIDFECGKGQEGIPVGDKPQTGVRAAPIFVLAIFRRQERLGFCHWFSCIVFSSSG